MIFEAKQEQITKKKYLDEYKTLAEKDAKYSDNVLKAHFDWILALRNKNKKVTDADFVLNVLSDEDKFYLRDFGHRSIRSIYPGEDGTDLLKYRNLTVCIDIFKDAQKGKKTEFDYKEVFAHMDDNKIRAIYGYNNEFENNEPKELQGIHNFLDMGLAYFVSRDDVMKNYLEEQAKKEALEKQKQQEEYVAKNGINDIVDSDTFINNQNSINPSD